MKRLLTIVLCAGLLVSMLCSCAAPPASEPTQSAPAAAPEAEPPATAESPAAPAQAAVAEEPVTVELFQAKVEIKDTLEELAQVYMSKHPNVTINVTTIGGGEDWAVALQARFLSNNAPDIFVVNGAQNCVDWASKLEDLRGTACIENVFESAIADVTIDNKVLGIPFNLEGLGLVYNKKLFEAAGVDATAITTWDALTEAVKTLDAQKDALGIEAVFAQNCKNYQALSNTAATIFLSPELGSAANALQAKTLQFTYGDQFKAFMDLTRDYGVQPSLNIDYSTQVEQYFCMGKVAIIPQGNWIFNTVNGIDPELASNMGILAVPVTGVATPQLCMNVPYWWVVNNDSDETVKKAAKDFLDYMYTSDEGKDFVVNKLNFIPAYNGFESYALHDPLSRDVYDYFLSGNSIPFVYSAYPAGWGSDSFAVYLQKYLANEMTWDEVIQESIASWEAARK